MTRYVRKSFVRQLAIFIFFSAAQQRCMWQHIQFTQCQKSNASLFFFLYNQQHIIDTIAKYRTEKNVIFFSQSAKIKPQKKDI